jgi:hypothetical protein
MDERQRYAFPPGGQFLMTLWIVVWLFLSVAICAAQSTDIGAAMLLWISGSLIGSLLIVWAMGGMQETGGRDVFGAARFADDRSEIERAGLKGPGDN